VAALLAIIAVAAGCSSDAAPAVPTSSVSAPGSVAPAVSTPPMAKSAPVRVQIPAIGVDSALMQLGLQADGSLQVPPVGFPAGWYTGAPTPGELGPAILAGHVDWGGKPGVFYHLRDLKPDAEVTVTRQDGSAAVFRVTQVEEYPKDKFPTAVVYGDLDHAGLRLITCGGSFDRQARSYDDNIVAFADLVATRPASPA
jgi:sortase (surface protein transpeptidase)